MRCGCILGLVWVGVMGRDVEVVICFLLGGVSLGFMGIWGFLWWRYCFFVLSFLGDLEDVSLVLDLENVSLEELLV